tara:strand:- start:1341 stop:1520 length:180 start_codon:yes stop_codon:yes gene_type:complete
MLTTSVNHNNKGNTMNRVDAMLDELRKDMAEHNEALIKEMNEQNARLLALLDEVITAEF